MKYQKKKLVSGKFVKKSENKTKPFPCDAGGQTLEEKFNMKEHKNTNHEEVIEVLKRSWSLVSLARSQKTRQSHFFVMLVDKVLKKSLI